MLTDQISTLGMAMLENQLSSLRAATEAAMHGARQLSHLHTSLLSTSTQESSVILKALIGSEQPQQATALLVAQLQPNTQKMLIYGRHLMTIAASIQDELQRAGQRQLSLSHHQLVRLAGTAANNNSPIEAQSVRAILSVLDNVAASYTQLSQASQRASAAARAALDETAERWSNIAPEPAPQARAAGQSKGRGSSGTRHASVSGTLH